MRPPPPSGVPATVGAAVGGSGVGVSVGRGNGVGVAVGGSGEGVAVAAIGATVGRGAVGWIACVGEGVAVLTGVLVARSAIMPARPRITPPSTITATPPRAAGITHPGHPDRFGVIGGAGTVSPAGRATVA